MRAEPEKIAACKYVHPLMVPSPIVQATGFVYQMIEQCMEHANVLMDMLVPLALMYVVMIHAMATESA